MTKSQKKRIEWVIYLLEKFVPQDREYLLNLLREVLEQPNKEF